MKKELFAELMQSVEEALEHAQGKRELRTTVLPEAPRPMSSTDIRAIRQELNASQAVFARFLNVSTQLVQAWEADRRRPAGAALRLLEIGSRQPEAVFAGLVKPPGTTTNRSRAVNHKGRQKARSQVTARSRQAARRK